MLGDGRFVNGRRAILFVAGGVCLSLAFYVVVSGGFREAISNIAASRTLRKPWDSAGNYGTELSPFHVVASSLLTTFAALALYLVLVHRVPRPQRMLVAFLGLIAITSVSIESGTRSTLLLCLIPPLIVYYRNQIGIRARSLKRTVIVSLVLLSALAISNLQRTYRTQGEVSDIDFEIKDNDFFVATAYAMAIAEREPRLTHDSPFWHIMTGPIPRVLWRGKPEIDAVAVYSRYVWGFDIRRRGGNTLPSIVGQYLLSWGWFGVIEIGFWLGLIVAMGDSALRRMRPLSLGRLGYAVLLTYLFVAFRTIGFFFFMPVLFMVLSAYYLNERPPRAAAESFDAGVWTGPS
jgi:oligosaccharide repeat unit polymerase